jgi:hypothetical protein
MAGPHQHHIELPLTGIGHHAIQTMSAGSSTADAVIEVAFNDCRYPPGKLAWRDDLVVRKQQEINSPIYRPLHRSNCREFAEKWAMKLLVNFEPSTQALTA